MDSDRGTGHRVPASARRAARAASSLEGNGELARLEELLERAGELAAQQRPWVVAAAGSIEQRAAVRRALQGKLLRYLTGVGAVAARENAELGAQFRLPRMRATNLAFVTLARGMLAKATEHKDLLVKRGLSEGVLAAIASALEEFEQTLEATRAARREHVGASGNLRAVASEDTLAGAVARRSGALPVRGRRRADDGVGQRAQRAGAVPVEGGAGG